MYGETVMLLLHITAVFKYMAILPQKYNYSKFKKETLKTGQPPLPI